MFIQNGGNWTDLTENVLRHKVMILTVGSSDMTGSLRLELNRRINRKQPGLGDKVIVERSQEYDENTMYASKKAYLIKLGSFDKNIQAKQLLEQEW